MTKTIQNPLAEHLEPHDTGRRVASRRPFELLAIDEKFITPKTPGADTIYALRATVETSAQVSEEAIHSGALSIVVKSAKRHILETFYGVYRAPITEAIWKLRSRLDEDREAAIEILESVLRSLDGR